MGQLKRDTHTHTGHLTGSVYWQVVWDLAKWIYCNLTLKWRALVFHPSAPSLYPSPLPLLHPFTPFCFTFIPPLYHPLPSQHFTLYVSLYFPLSSLFLSVILCLFSALHISTHPCHHPFNIPYMYWLFQPCLTLFPSAYSSVFLLLKARTGHK